MTIRYGFNIDTFNPANAMRDCARAKGLGASWVRVSIEQDFGGPAGPVAMLLKYRAAATANGLLLVNTCQPAGHIVPAGAAIPRYATYVASMAPHADLTGIVNEPNLLQHPATGRTSEAPQDWAAVTMACIAARDAHAPGCQILLPEIADICTNGPKDPLAWFQAMVTAQPGMLAAAHVSVGWHGYCAPGYDATKWAAGHPEWNSCKRIEDLYAFLKSKGAGGLTICNTEFGSDGRGSASQQATDMAEYDKEHQAIVALGATLDCCCWYTLRNHFDAHYPQWGMVYEPPDPQAADTNKPVAAAFTAATKQGPPPPPPLQVKIIAPTPTDPPYDGPTLKLAIWCNDNKAAVTLLADGVVVPESVTLTPFGFGIETDVSHQTGGPHTYTAHATRPGASVVSAPVVLAKKVVTPPPPTGNPPMFLAYGAGKPTHAQILKYRNQGAAGIRLSIDWDGHDTNFSGAATNLAFYDDLFKYCNSLTLLPGVTPAPGATGFAVICQTALGATWNGQLYNEHATLNGKPFNVPMKHAQWGGSLVDHYKPSRGNGIVWLWEGGNEPNHAKAGAKSGIDVSQYGAAYAKFFGYWKRLGRAADPAAKFMCGGLGGHRDSPTDVPAWTFVKQMYAANIPAASSYDGVAQPNGIEGLFDYGCNHPYCQWMLPSADIAAYLKNPDPNGHGFKGWSEMVYLSWPEYIGVDANLTFCVTESGQQNPYTDASGTHSVAAAADVLEDAVRLWKTYPRSAHGANPYCWFQAEDGAANVHGPFGLWDVNGKAKEPLATRFHDLATGKLVV